MSCICASMWPEHYVVELQEGLAALRQAHRTEVEALKQRLTMVECRLESLEGYMEELQPTFEAARRMMGLGDRA
jgi:hypothetical protein